MEAPWVEDVGDPRSTAPNHSQGCLGPCDTPGTAVLGVDCGWGWVAPHNPRFLPLVLPDSLLS